MKQLFGSILTLSVILIFCIQHMQNLETVIHTTSFYLEQALQAQDKKEAAAAAGHASQSWKDAQTILGLTLRHDQLDEVAESLALLESYAQSEDVDDFRSHCLSLLAKLSHILQMERPLPENII